MAPTDPALLIVAEPTDTLADGLADYARGRALTVERLDHRAAAGRMTIQRLGGRTTVTPSCPLFLRPPAAPPPGTGDQRLFHHAEIRGLVWAAAALTTAHVVNRPGRYGLGGRISGSTAVLRHRAGLPGQEPEVFAGHASSAAVPRSDGDWWFQHRRSWATVPASGVVSDRGPYRVGRIPAGSTAVITCVVGARVFVLARTGDAGGDLTVADLAADDRARELSAQVAGALGLTFGTLAWRRGDAADLELGRVNPCPSLAELGHLWAAVREALIGELCP
ncbi:hypothetical protein [Kitasatospora sp. NPDC085879]|uniref:hypothetical protein n=1 Tax=Kitasatospora sp. NPDC085879 TaxID=3154769 RepID=UPI0034493593